METLSAEEKIDETVGLTVQDIAIKGGRAAARFSNGEAVELHHATQVGDVWWIAELGGNAGRKFFK